MPLIRTLMWMAARQAASNPAVRRAAADAARKAGPAVGRAAREVRMVAQDRPPLKQPLAFAREIAQRFNRPR